MAATLGCTADSGLFQASSALHYRQNSSHLCSTSRGPAVPTFGAPFNPIKHARIPPQHVRSASLKGLVEESSDAQFQFARRKFRYRFGDSGLAGSGRERGSVAVRAKGRPKLDDDEDADEALDMEVVDVGEDPFNEAGMSFEEAPAKVAKKTMEERMAFVTKDDVSKRTEMKEFTDKSGNKVFLEVAVQDKSPEELEALAWRDRRLMDETVANPPNMDSFYMNPFTFRAVLPEAREDNDEFVFERYPDVDSSDDEINDAFRDDTGITRDENGKPNEEWYDEDWAGPLTVAELEHTRFMMPSAWEGKLDDEREIYIKHRYGVLNVMVLHRRGSWRKKWNTVYYILHKHALNSQCTTKRMRELLEGKILNFACEIKFADRFDNIYDLYEGYDVERKMLRSRSSVTHPNWELRTDLSKKDKIEVLEKTKEAFFKERGAARKSVTDD